MTPEEKAEKLVWIYYHKIEHTISDEYAKVDWEIAKQCALIAVDEVLNFIHTDAFSYTNEEYWQQVKKEIEKL